MATTYTVTHPEAQYHRYRSLCGINTTALTTEYRGMGTLRRSFASLEEAQQFIHAQTDPTSCYRIRIPVNPVYGAGYREMEQRTLRKDECKITVEVGE